MASKFEASCESIAEVDENMASPGVEPVNSHERLDWTRPPAEGNDFNRASSVASGAIPKNGNPGKAGQAVPVFASGRLNPFNRAPPGVSDPRSATQPPSSDPTGPAQDTVDESMASRGVEPVNSRERLDWTRPPAEGTDFNKASSVASGAIPKNRNPGKVGQAVPTFAASGRLNTYNRAPPGMTDPGSATQPPSSDPTGPAQDTVDGGFEDSSVFQQQTAYRHPLTVLKEPQLNPETLEKESQKLTGQGPSTLLIAFKWIAIVVTGTVFLWTLIVSKLTIVHLASHLHNLSLSGDHDLAGGNSTASGPTPPVYGVESVFFMIVITISLPSGFTLLRSAWCGLLRSDRPWPSRWALAWGVVASVLESCGISLLAISILSNAMSLTSISVMNGVFLVPILFYVVKNAREGRSSQGFFIMTILALITEILGIISMVVSVILGEADDLQKDSIWQLVLSLVCISVAWAPWVQEQQLYPSKEQFRELYMAKHNASPTFNAQEGVANPGLDTTEESAGTSGLGSMPSNPSSSNNPSLSGPNERQSLSSGGTRSLNSRYSSVTSRASESSTVSSNEIANAYIDVIFRDTKMSARWKNSILTSLFKLILIPGFSMLWGYVLNIYLPSSLQAGINHVNSSNPVFRPFMFNIFGSLGGYLVGWLACCIGIQRSAFAIPLLLATPLSFIFLLAVHMCGSFFSDASFECQVERGALGLVFSALGALFLYLAQVCSTSFFLFRTQTTVMQKESNLFWLPNYSSVMLEQCMLLNRRNVQTDDNLEDPREKVKRSRVFICTPMYREAPHEMEQLLESFRKINLAKQSSGRNFCSHIFMDNGVRDLRLTKFALQLIYVVKQTLGVDVGDCTKVQTPYGLRLSWQLPNANTDQTESQQDGMDFTIHLKDNQKVKNKKRWSQVMYLSYVLDYFIREDRDATDEESFVLTTDADVQFSPEAAEALLDLMSRDSGVGGVCARTFPMGSGPVYWYQIFDYAIGHWLQKAANHVSGSVLCCPGCFSVFRVAAVRDVLSTFATPVTEASEFLTKDMGEDRWFCTLMIQSGWRMEYCAAVSDSTYCPTDFDEFWNQRRRWIPSTMANIWLLLCQWDTVSHYNKNMSYWFKIYQVLLLISTLMSPSMCILIIVGGAYYAWEVSQWLISGMALVVVIGYGLICLYCSQKTQLKVGKILTVLSSFLMAAVLVGMITKIGIELQPIPTRPNRTTVAPWTPPRTSPTTARVVLLEDSFDKSTMSDKDVDQFQLQALVQDYPDPDPDLPPTPPPVTIVELPRGLSLSTLYFAGMVGLFLVCGLAHLSEFSCLFHGVWYLLFLPAANIFQMTYSICNITDRSWGTREEKKAADLTSTLSWTEKALVIWRQIFFCCDKTSEGPPERGPPRDISSDEEDGDRPEPGGSSGSLRKKRLPQSPLVGPFKGAKIKIDRSHSFRFHPEVEDVVNWLPKNFQQEYGPKFRDNGYEDITFVAGMTEKELEQIIGVKNGAHRHAILKEISKLPEIELEPGVPDLVDDWLIQIDLPMYQNHFRYCQIINRTDMEILKQMTPKDIQQDLKIVKPGHLKRLMLAINCLYYPTKAEKEMAKAKFEIEALHLHQLATVKSEEHLFWENLRQACLLPDSGAFANDLDLKAKLTELRNSWLMMFAIVNAIWLIIIQTMASKMVLNVQGTNIIGLIFLVIFGLVLVVQFLCMLIHRVGTWAHMIARAPLKAGKPLQRTWAFDDRSLAETPDGDALTSADVEAQTNRRIIKETTHEKHKDRAKKLRGRNSTRTDEAAPLLGDNTRNQYNAVPT